MFQAFIAFAKPAFLFAAPFLFLVGMGLCAWAAQETFHSNPDSQAARRNYHGNGICFLLATISYVFWFWDQIL